MPQNSNNNPCFYVHCTALGLGKFDPGLIQNLYSNIGPDDDLFVLVTCRHAISGRLPSHRNHTIFMFSKNPERRFRFVHLPYEHCSVAGTDAHVFRVRAEDSSRPITANLEAVGGKLTNHLSHCSQVNHAKAVVSGAGQYVLTISRKIHGSHFSFQNNLVRRLSSGPDVVEPDFLVEMAGNDLLIEAGQVVAAGTGEERVDACAGAQVPDLDGSVVAPAANVLLLSAHELGRKYLGAVPGQSMS